MTLQAINYRARYYWRALSHFLGFCPRCFTAINRTRSGAAICPNCRAR